MEPIVKPIPTEPSEDTQKRIDYLNGAKDDWEVCLIEGVSNGISPLANGSNLSDEDTRRENMYEDAPFLL